MTDTFNGLFINCNGYIRKWNSLMFLPRSNDHVFCLLRVDGHEVISSSIEYLVSRKLECSVRTLP